MTDVKPGISVAFNDILDLLRKHARDVSAEEMLAIASNLVGKLIAFQDSSKVTPEAAMKVVIENIKVGNAEVLKASMRPAGRS